MVEATTLVSILLGLFTFAAGGFGVWLYRHESWFRDIVFPVIQVLTGENPRGGELPADGHIEEADMRLNQLEERIESIDEQVEDLSRTQKRHNRETESYLRRIVGHLDGMDEEEAFDDEEPLFRGGNSAGSGSD